jgi:hypothetical protein
MSIPQKQPVAEQEAFFGEQQEGACSVAPDGNELSWTSPMASNGIPTSDNAFTVLFLLQADSVCRHPYVP